MIRNDLTNDGRVPRRTEEETLLSADDSGLIELDDEVDELDADDEDTDLEGEEPKAEEAAPPEDDYTSGPDDALGLYLRQMGAIPLLNREKELSLAQRLEYHRDRFRHAALLCGRILQRVAEKFEHIAAGQAPIDPHIDAYSSPELKLKRENVLNRLNRNLATLKKLLGQEAEEFAAGMRDEYPGSAATWRVGVIS